MSIEVALGPTIPQFTRTLLDSMTEGVSLTSEDGTIVYTNAAEDRMFGYEHGELVGQHVSVQNAYPPDENARIFDEVITELRRSGSWRGEWLNRRKDGSSFVTTSRISTVELEGRSYWLCVQEDVTKEKGAITALEESRARLDIATQAAEIGIWDWDLPTGKMNYSALAKAICGFHPDQIVTIEDAIRVTHPEDYPRTSEMARRALDPKIRERIPYEYRVVRSDGGVRWVLAHGEAIFSGPSETDTAIRYLGTLQDITERRQLVEADRQGRARLALALEAGRMAVWEIDLKTDEVTGSPELNRILGFPEHSNPTAEEMRARYYPGERERLEALGQETLARGERVLEAEYRYVLPGNSIRWLWMRAEAFLGRDGVPERAIGVVLDITDRKLAEEELKTSETRMKLAQQAAGFGVWDWEVETGHITWSAEMYDIFGLDLATPRADLFPAWISILHSDDRLEAEAAALKAAEDGTPFRIEFRILHRLSGEQRWIRSHGLALLNQEGRPARVLGAVLDITDQRRREEELQALAGDLQSAVDAGRVERDRIYELTNDLFAVAGFDGYLKSINPAWERLLGYSTLELLTQPFVELIHPEDRNPAGEVLATLSTGNAIRRFEDRLRKANGDYVWIAWAAVPDGDRFYAVGRDVTRDKEREDALRQSQKMEAIGQLTGGIAHDFNNLLGAVTAGLDLIRRKPEDPAKVRRWAEQGIEAAERGAKLTGQLLAFSRAQRLDLRAVDLHRILLNIHDLLATTLGPLVRLRFDFGEEVFGVLSDPIQLELAILNLAINARDAMPAGGQIILAVRYVEIGEGADVPPGDYVELSVSDTGSGMSADVLARAINPFFTTKGVGKGTGLGLSQVYGIARQAGGTVHIESVLGEGTTVRLLLPRVEVTPTSTDRDAQEISHDQPQGSILVVDDDPDMRRAIAEQLRELGYRVRSEPDGASGLSALDQDKPSALILDFAMPDMNGAEVAKMARVRYPDLPIIFASGYSSTQAIEDAVGRTAPILRKPFRLRDLQQTLSNLIRKSLD